MPTPPTAKWPKPKGEDEFEDIVLDFVRLRWKDPNATRQGRRGQGQHGVDIVGHPPRLQGKPAAAQCKNTESLTLATVRKEVDKAKLFPDGLGEFLVVTAAERDASLQNEVRQYFGSNPPPFPVHVIFWPDIVGELAGHPGLVAKHWKGFADSTASERTLPPPARIDRDGVRPEETKECQCEIALLSPSLDLASNELRDFVINHLREERSDTVFNRLVAVTGIRELVRRAATRTSDRHLWSDRSRDLTNVIIKRELEIGDRGGLTYRWAEFTTGENILRTTLFVPGVVVPLALHRLALRRAANVLGISLESETVIRFAAHGSGALIFMDDMDPKITEPFLLSVPYSDPDWSFETKASESAGLRAVAVRVLNRALSHFQVGHAAIHVKDGMLRTLLPEDVH